MRVIVAGGGLAGFTAALRAVELGARTTLLEKGGLPGGSFLLSSGYAWSYRDLPTFRREAPGGDPGLQNLILERLEPYIGWLERQGCPVLSRETGNPLTFGARLDPEGTVGALARRIADLGGEILPNTALDGLLNDTSGRVTGTRTNHGDELAADAAILSSGGFAGNPELVSRHIIGGPGRMRLRSHPRSTGDGFLAAQAVGARTSAGMDEFYGRNLPAPPAEFSPAEFVEVSQLYGRHAVAINTRGERYADEGADWSETALTRTTARQPGLRAWYVLDAAGLEGRVRERTAGEMVEAAKRAGGTVLETPTLEELAEALAKHGLPRDITLRTLREYNQAVADGRGDELSPPRTGPAAPARVPPFVAVEVAPTITHTVGGLAVDERCGVLRLEDGGPIPGLYAAGVEVGGVSTGGYTSGLAAAVVFGRIAAESSLGH
ncbi:FAD-binding protein [Rubrobacter tropicus]|uniref:FAD-binding protein n=1 Tax=Rubrobacter tropicus TaxID=2653851 RepID=A0A6G8Q5V4_9ACTN|nr:FAD-binding protein [Rubrobacter tropicus]QIN81818.1 FAD-binding protein [Rubrobacter tropicus]